MNLRKFSKVLIVLGLMLFVICGGVVEKSYKLNVTTTKCVAAIDGGVMEDAIHVIPFNM